MTKMKRLRFATTVADALQGHRPVSRTARQLSTALQRNCPSSTSRALTCAASPLLRLPTQFATSVRHASSSAPSSELQKTPLYDFHVTQGGKMVPFGGFHMPVQYDSLSVSESHHFTRSHASLFDVSHMVQHRFSGPGATAFLELVTPMSVTTLDTHHGGLSALLLPVTGGIVDDTIITRLGPESFYVVTNAGCREKDLAYFNEQLADFANSSGQHVNWEVLEGWGLVALQGPLSQDILQSLVSIQPGETNLGSLYFGQSRYIRLQIDGRPSSPLLVSRGGYTGEDGFEISIPPAETVAVTEALLKAGTPQRLQLAGLGARDSLRLEAGMCLYGHDMDELTTPVEASLSWIIGKERKQAGGFHGADVILNQLLPKSKGGNGVDRRRIGLIVQGAPARESYQIVDEDGYKIGNITSGCPSPTLKENIAMGYIKTGFHLPGTEVEVVIRGKKRKAVVTKMPFVPSNYWRAPMKAAQK